MAYKRLYLAGRNPAIAVEDFPRQWRRHAKVAGGFPTVGVTYSRVQQCTKIANTDAIPGSSNSHAGVALLTMPKLVVSKPSEDSQEIREKLRPDEVRVFGDVVSKWSLYTEEVVAKDGPPDKVCVMQFLKRKEGLSGDEFHRYWSATHAPLLLRLDVVLAGVRRYVQDRVLVEPPEGYEFDGVSELWFDTLDDAIKTLTDERYRATVASDHANFCKTGDMVTMVTEVTHSWSPAVQ